MSAFLPPDSEELFLRRQRNRYQIPTHLDVPDKLSIHLLGWTMSVTIRQGLILLLGWSTAFNLWKHLDGLDSFGTPGIIVHFLLPGVLALITFVYSTLTIAGRHPEAWVPVLLSYMLHPRQYMWSSLPSPETEQLAKTGERMDQYTMPVALAGLEQQYSSEMMWGERVRGREHTAVPRPGALSQHGEEEKREGLLLASSSLVLIEEEEA